MPVPRETAASHSATSDYKILVTKVFVRGLRIEAEIGVYPHEQGRHQPLLVDVELDVAAGGWRHLADTVNYESVVEAAKSIAAAGHIGLVESYAQRLADACFAQPRVLRARIRVEKPQALAPDAAAAGVEITAVRG